MQYKLNNFDLPTLRPSCEIHGMDSVESTELNSLHLGEGLVGQPYRSFEHQACVDPFHTSLAFSLFGMIRFLLGVILLLTTPALAQRPIDELLKAEYKASHFNGAVLAVKQGRIVSQVNKGYANLQFQVPITNDTRFPIASMTKLFTAVLALQLVEKGSLQLEDKVSVYVPDLPANCQNITIQQLLTHTSGLKNEPIQAYRARYATAEYVQKYVVKDEKNLGASFNYNNVDYVLLTRLLEIVSKQSFATLVQANIFTPLKMTNSGVLKEERVISNLAYGYHNYTFGRGSSKDTLRNDSRYISNYAGAGAIYSTVTDLYKMVQALQATTLLSAKTTNTFLVKPQQTTSYLDYARGYPTIGFYFNDKTLPEPVLERRGSIDGFNSVLLADKEFKKVVLILTNTDQGDLEIIGDKIYKALD
jgi:CubicO group peptidase (beta-lactamase class C family)